MNPSVRLSSRRKRMMEARWRRPPVRGVSDFPKGECPSVSQLETGAISGQGP
jgi:hypothetical protein